MEERKTTEPIKLNWNFNYEFNGEHHSRTKYVIYKIENTISNKVYIGQTRREINKRWDDYKKDLLKPIQVEKRSGSNIKLKRSVQYYFKKFNNVNFLLFSIAEVVDIASLTTDEEKQKSLDEREIFHIKEYRKLHGKSRVCNVLDGGKTYIFTEEDKKKISAALKGKHFSPNTEFKSSKVSGENNPFYGKKHSQETKEKLRLKSKQYNTEEIREKRSEAYKGKRFSPKTEFKKGIKINWKIYENFKLLNPNTGEIITRIECLSQFARDNNLKREGIRDLLKGKLKTYKGWKPV